jgi:C4-type Zn-finger protein
VLLKINEVDMKCLICESTSNYYFSKSYDDAPFKDLMSGIGEVSYYKCEKCGFVLSKTHGDLDEANRSSEILFGKHEEIAMCHHAIKAAYHDGVAFNQNP